jgi:acetylglutamate kinase
VSRVVVKVGGNATADSVALALVERLSAANAVVVVHGAGEQITREMERRGLSVEFVAGRRVTTPKALEIVRESYAEVNAQLCRELGSRAIGLFGDDIGLQAEPMPELGLVGEAVPSCPRAVVDALAAGLIPVVAPIAVGPLNVNADDAATALAIGIGAARILFVSDVPGLLRNGAVMPSIAASEAHRLLAAGELEGGIVPKLQAAVTAARRGVQAEIGTTLVLA